MQITGTVMNSGAALAEAPKSVQAHFLKLVISCRVLSRKEGHNCKSTFFFLLPVPPFNSPLSHALLGRGCLCGFTLQYFVVIQMCKPCGFLQAYLCLLALFPFLVLCPCWKIPMSFQNERQDSSFEEITDVKSLSKSSYLIYSLKLTTQTSL